MKDVVWVGDSRERLQQFPKGARQTIGKALTYAQLGDKHPTAKPMRASGQGSFRLLHGILPMPIELFTQCALEIECMYCFEKKSTRGIRTPIQKNL